MPWSKLRQQTFSEDGHVAGRSLTCLRERAEAQPRNSDNVKDCSMDGETVILYILTTVRSMDGKHIHKLQFTSSGFPLQSLIRLTTTPSISDAQKLLLKPTTA